ncbi:MAG: hypothetical protein MJE77_09705, partial [Proteobacteria bacterium]|nr:hypothetical protein [Pseudomonadota bacterium]
DGLGGPDSVDDRKNATGDDQPDSHLPVSLFLNAVMRLFDPEGPPPKVGGHCQKRFRKATRPNVLDGLNH